MKVLSKRQEGFSLLELMIVLLIVAILAGVAAPLYVGYAREGRTAEAKGIVHALWTALQGCAQFSFGSPCVVRQHYGRAGIDSSGNTFDGRWTVAAGGDNTLTLNTAITTLQASASPLITLSGQASDNTGLSVQYIWDNAQLSGSFMCDTGAGLAAC